MNKNSHLTEIIQKSLFETQTKSTETDKFFCYNLCDCTNFTF